MNEPENSMRTGPWQRAPSEPAASDRVAVEWPQWIGRYRVERLLGEGGFGRVFLAYDDRLNRPVAIKVPHLKLIARPEDAEVYLAEAQNVANLDHPHIVPVYDVGSTGDCPCFIVSKFIAGRTLAQRIQEDRPSFMEAAELVATVAQALQYAHRHGLVHRDIKPGNILLDTGGTPHLADFGLALKEEQVGQGPKYAGTPAYMSPEQARGEGHRVDGRADIFSLGMVFYELLTGRRPFKGESREDLLEQITSFEPRPLRQIDESIPREMERICFKALSKRAADRYMTAKDMADDLRHCLAEQILSQQAIAAGKGVRSPLAAPVGKPPSLAVGSSPSGASSTTARTPTSDSPPIKIVPKGLRSFDAHDADFFLELLPGPRDREGLPDSIRFWKTRIEETDPDQTFAVGLLYGPSGCGKSSLVKAGLIPRLADVVLTVYIEATANETESRLLHGLRKRCPSLPVPLDLKDTLAALRRGQGLPVGKKVLIVIDQFEQWLHAKKEEEHTELVQALRQCDGERLQCVVLVRDDFWLAVSRFMTALEIDLLQGMNMGVVDLFDPRHARKVLTAFGRAFSALPEGGQELTKDQDTFLDQAASGLAQDGKIISVRLALFAEMVKGKPWTLATLKEVGGAEGVGLTFLEDTFASPTSNPKHRVHQKAARAVLRALLPESGTDIRGHMRSHAELLVASGYASRPKEFDELLRILDGEVRLITPTDPEGKEVPEESSAQVQATEKYYQLTHDYLVPSLRDWLTRKQKETSCGRAELMLADRAAIWNARREKRQLPSLWQWLRIRWLTQKKHWTPSQRKMMRVADRFFATRLCLYLFLLAAVGWTAVEGIGSWYTSYFLMESFRAAPSSYDLRLLQELKWYSRWTIPALKQLIENDPNPERRNGAAHMLIEVDPGQADYLSAQLLRTDWKEFMRARNILASCMPVIGEQLWRVLIDSNAPETERVRAAYLLASYDLGNPRWLQIAREASLLLVKIEPTYLIIQPTNLVKEGPVFEFRTLLQHPLVEPLREIIHDSNRQMSPRVTAMFILGDFDVKELVEQRGPEEVPAVYDQAIATVEPLLTWNAGFYASNLFHAGKLLFELHRARADALTRQGRHDVALKDWMRALELTEPGHHYFYGSEMERAYVLAHVKHHVRATAEASLLVEKKNPNAVTLYDAACVFALSTAAVPNDSVQGQAYANRALELLRRAVISGYKDAEHMKKDSNLDAIRSRSDFRELLGELEEMAKGQAKQPGGGTK